MLAAWIKSEGTLDCPSVRVVQASIPQSDMRVNTAWRRGDGRMAWVEGIGTLGGTSGLVVQADNSLIGR